MKDDIKNSDSAQFYEFIGAAGNLYMRVHAERNELLLERNRLLVLATKHCPKNHHDWQEILMIAGDESSRQHGI